MKSPEEGAAFGDASLVHTMPKKSFHSRKGERTANSGQPPQCTAALGHRSESSGQSSNASSHEAADGDFGMNAMPREDRLHVEKAREALKGLYLKNSFGSNASDGNSGGRRMPSPAAAAAAAPSAAQDANDVVYKALMEHKNAEMQRMATLASDTRTITEAMLRKQVFSC